MLRNIIVFGFFLAGFLSSLTQAHDYPIHPVKINMKVEPKIIHTAIKTNVVYWREKVLGSKCAQPGNWPEDIKQKAKDYIDYHFSIFLDDEILKGSLIDSRYVEAPFAGADNAELVFTIDYPITVAGRDLTIVSKFFNEYHSHIKSQHHDTGHKHRGKHKVFAANLNITGENKQKYVLTLENPGRTLSFENVLITPEQRSVEFLGLGFSYVTKEYFAVMIVVLVLILLCLGRIFVMQVSVLLYLLFAGFLFGLAFHSFQPGNVLLLWKLSGLIVLSGMIYFQSADALKLPVLFIAMPAWGFSAAREIRFSDAAAGAVASAGTAFFTGWIFAIALIFIAVYMLFAADKRYIVRKSKSMADKLFKQHLRFISLLVLMASIYFMLKIIRGGA